MLTCDHQYKPIFPSVPRVPQVLMVSRPFCILFKEVRYIYKLQRSFSSSPPPKHYGYEAMSFFIIKLAFVETVGTHRRSVMALTNVCSIFK
jgi:hypothetical protein